MAGEYAARTDVPVSRSRDEIEATLNRFGASGFAYSNYPPDVTIAFEIGGIRVMMKMRLPVLGDIPARGANGRLRTASAIQKDHEQACRQRWRTLANAVKAKLAMVDDGISTIEREFLADVVIGNGYTIGDVVTARDLPAIIESGHLPALMPGTREG